MDFYLFLLALSQAPGEHGSEVGATGREDVLVSIVDMFPYEDLYITEEPPPPDILQGCEHGGGMVRCLVLPAPSLTSTGRHLTTGLQLTLTELK